MPIYNLYATGNINTHTVQIPTNIECNYYRITVKSLILNNITTKPYVTIKIHSFTQELGYLSKHNNELFAFIEHFHLIYQHPIILIFDRPLQKDTTIDLHLELIPTSSLYLNRTLNKYVTAINQN